MTCDTQYYIEAGTECYDIGVGGGFNLDICFGAPGETGPQGEAGPQGPKGDPIDVSGFIKLLQDLPTVENFEMDYVFESDGDAILAGRTGF